MRHSAPFANFSEKASRPLPGVPPTAGLGSQSARETPRNDRPGRVQGGVPIDARARERANPAPDPRLRPRPRRAQRAIHAGSVAPRFSVPSAARRQIEGGGSPHGGPGSQMPRRGTRTEPNSAAVRLHTPRRASVLMGSWARGARDHATFGRRGNSSETPPKGESKLAAGSAPRFHGPHSSRHPALRNPSSMCAWSFRPMPRDSPANKHVEGGRRHSNGLCQHFLCFLYAAALAERRGEPAILV